MKKKFIYQDNSSHKFWDIEFNLTSLTVTFGKYGTQGQMQTKLFPTVEECMKAAEKLIAEKTKKGYTPLVEDLPPKELYNDPIALARMLEAQFPDKVEITPVSAENISEMAEVVGFPLDEAFQAYWREKGSFFFDKDDFVCVLYAFDQNGQNANNLYGFLSFYCQIYGCHFAALDEELDFLSQATMVLGMIINGKEKWVMVNNCVGVYQIHFEKEFQHYSEEEFMRLLEPVMEAKAVANFKVTERRVDAAEELAEEEATDSESGDSPEDEYDFKEMSYTEVLELLDVDQLFDNWDGNHGYDSEEEYFDDYGDIFVHEGDLQVNKDLDSVGGLLVVTGNLTVAGRLGISYYVMGNVTTAYLNLSALQHTGGTETVRYLAIAWGQDDEVVHTMPFRKINAPHFVSWFYDLDCFEFSPDTVITALYNQDSLNFYKTKNTFLAWHNYALAFRSEYCYVVESANDDMLGLDTSDLYHALRDNQPVWKDGVTEEGIRLTEDAMYAVGRGEASEAYHGYKAAIAAAPGYYLAYYKAGEVLFAAKAYAQALVYFKQGIPLSPDKLRYDYGCIGRAALCAVRLGNYDEAIAIAKQARDTDYFPLRVLGEALILKGKLDEAKRVLEKSVEIRSVFSNYWLLGLVYYLQGDKKTAIEHYDTASYYNKQAKPYEEHTNLHYFYGDNVQVNWDAEGPSKVVKDQAYWQAYFYNKPASFDTFLHVPEEFRTSEMLSKVLENENEPGHIVSLVSPALITQEIILQAVDRESPLRYQDIPAEFLNDEVFARHRDGVDLEFLPDDKKTYELCFNQVVFNQYNYRYVPDAFKDERMNIALIAGGNLSDVHCKDFPKKYYTYEYIIQAIDLGIQVINNIPAKLVSKEVYEYAVAKYGQEREWPFIVDRNNRDRWKYGASSDVMDMAKHILENTIDQVDVRQINKHSYAYYKKYLAEVPAAWEARKDITNEYLARKEFDYTTFDNVWACFWDEAFIIKALKADERLYNVDARYITPAIVEAALKKNTCDFPYVPKEFLTPALCEKVFSAGDYDELDAVPLGMRSLKICSYAVAGSADNFKYVPLELRDPEFCAAVVAREPAMSIYVPHQHYAATFEMVDKRFANRVDKGFIWVNWGLGLILNGEYEQALKKLEKVQDEYRHEAVYYIGWAAHLQGDTNSAKELWKQSQEIAKAAELDDQEWIKYPYAAFQLPEVPGVYEFNQATFDKQMMEASLLVQDKQYEAAISLLQEIEKMLTDAQSDEMRLWAYVWDHQRYALYEAGQQSASLAVCERMIAELGKVTLWEYLEAHNPIRAALRAAHNNLAYRCYEEGNVVEGLKHSKACMKTIAAIEDKSVLNPFYETQALLMHKAGDEKGFEKAVAKIRKLKLLVGEELGELMS
ncbi:WGR domain-containing protein [Chitinophaga sancti]|uniref:WGR domain-containing protein n=1 Tax=Chitinophaga sancti TaxID=1004 RepID=A0A1K1S1H7_9BACT|nr:WGR domain-containing protein [Chitinophaga sancti]WQD59743.1 WGR domain-containing protein [Chitinophaga sancti]WQG88126.1 WGR domain-containing protein [Chitinophaga sancti]SFW78010.1 WGR domain-containing protein, predicted DNA-binding domain in MolR [Chitinophaga sancti]